MNKLLLRSVSGIMYVALIAGSLFLGATYFCVLCMVLGAIGIVEFSRLMTPGNGIRIMPVATDMFGILCLLSVPLWHMLPGGSGSASLLLGAMFWILYLLLRYVAAIYDSSKEALHYMALSVFAVTYLSVGFLAAQFISIYSPMLVLLLFIFIWINDTGAYIVGSTIGRHRLFERLSPKKSWEGFFGGLLLVVLAGILLGYTGGMLKLLGVMAYYGVGPYQLVYVLPVVTVVFATLGDLFESMLKRTVGAKDSGTLIPGHGGLLDRVDSMLFVMPAAALFLLTCILI